MPVPPAPVLQQKKEIENVYINENSCVLAYECDSAGTDLRVIAGKFHICLALRELIGNERRPLLVFIQICHISRGDDKYCQPRPFLEYSYRFLRYTSMKQYLLRTGSKYYRTSFFFSVMPYDEAPDLNQ